MIVKTSKKVLSLLVSCNIEAYGMKINVTVLLSEGQEII